MDRNTSINHETKLSKCLLKLDTNAKATAIMHEASVTFLGFGLSPHEPAIGIILSESMKYLATGDWWLALFPGLALLILVLLFDIAGENVKKMLDPTSAND